jgi:hypothetical protein
VRRGEWIWAGACALFTTMLAAILSGRVFGRIPHVQDSIAQLFQARIFAQGRLWASSPPCSEFFNYAHMINDGRWYSQYPPGHSLLLVPGIWLGAPWLINPLLGGLGVLATVLLAREMADGTTARLAGILGALSPFLVLMASEFMSHVSGFCALTFYLFLHLRALRTGHPGSARAAAVCLALAILVRPYTALAVALPPLAYSGWLWFRSMADRRDAGRSARSRLYSPFLIVLAGGAAGAVLLGLYNWGTTGDPFVPGYIKLYGPSHGLGFGRGSWGGPHTLARGLNAAWDNLRSLNLRLFEWPLTSLWSLLVALLPLGRAQRPGRTTVAPDGPTLRHRWLLAAIPVSLLVAYVFYWYHDLCFGPRYLYEALGPLLVLSAFGLRRTGEFLSARLLPAADGWKRALPGGILVLGLFAYAGVHRWPALFRTPRASIGAAPDSPERMASYFQHYGREFWGVSPFLGELTAQRGLSNAIVFVHFTEPSYDSLLQMRYLWFGSAFAHEEPDLGKARIIFARDRGAENARLTALFPGRRAYLYTGSIEGGILQEVPNGVGIR